MSKLIRRYYLFLSLLTILIISNTGNAYAENQLTVNNITLSTSNIIEHTNKDFIFNIRAENASIKEWKDYSNNQKPAIVNVSNLKLLPNGIGLAFNGVNDSIVISNSRTLNPREEITIDIWCQFCSQGGDPILNRDWFTLVCKGDNWSNASYALLLAASSPSRDLRLILNGMTALNAKTYAANNVWYHIVAIVKNSSSMLFLNGKLLGSAPITSNIASNNNDLYIGHEESKIYPLDGIVGALRIYNRALSYDEVSSEYITHTSPLDAALILDLNFGGLYYFLEKSLDGISYQKVMRNPLNQTSFLWNENHSGKYFYRISFESQIQSFSNICSVNIIDETPKLNFSNFFCAVILIASMIVALLKNKNNQLRGH